MSIDYDELWPVFAFNSGAFRVAMPDGRFLITNGELIVAAPAEDAEYLSLPLKDDADGKVRALWEGVERDADRSVHLLPLPLKATGIDFDCVVLSVNGEMSFWQVQERYIEPFFRFPVPFLHPCMAGATPIVAVFDAATDALIGVIAPTSETPETKEPARGIESLLMLAEVNDWHRGRCERRAGAA